MLLFHHLFYHLFQQSHDITCVANLCIIYSYLFDNTRSHTSPFSKYYFENKSLILRLSKGKLLHIRGLSKKRMDNCGFFFWSFYKVYYTHMLYLNRFHNIPNQAKVVSNVFHKKKVVMLQRVVESTHGPA